MSGAHPSIETLEAYASGELRTGARLVLDLHLRACPSCRRDTDRMEAVGGALLGQEAPAALDPDALGRALASLDRPAPPPRLRLDDLVRRGIWLPLAPGLALKPLHRIGDPGERLVLIRVAGGRALPEHGHSGPERLVVITGGFEDHQGEYGRGDLVERGPEHRHRPVALPGETCVCLSATEGPLRLTGLARWLQPLVGI